MNRSPLQVDRGRLFGYSMYDFANSAFATTILAVLFNQYFARVVAGGATGVPIAGRMVPGATVWSWLVSLSMALVVLTGPLLGALADRSSGRLRFLIAFWLPGCILTALLATVGEGEWVRGGLLFGLAYFAFSASSIFYNALLPEVGPREALGRISGIAWGVGYVGGALLLVLNLLMLQSPQKLGFPEGTFGVQECFVSVAIWWFVFSLPTLWIFRYEALRPRRIVEPLGSLFRASLAEVRGTARSLARQRNLLRFFFAYLVYNDGVQTVVAMASIFGAEELGMEPASLILFFLLIQGTAFLGSLVLGPLADRWSHKGVLLLCVVAWAVLTTWGFAVGIFGNALGEYWVLGGTSGLFLGGIQTCSRSLLAKWIPEGRESEMFGFFSIMTRLAAVFGPLVYGGLVLATGSLRWAILSVAVFFVVGGALLATVREDEIPAEQASLARG
ncbi:MAG: MFS transporter [Candidatus Eisenbacteria bacterium]|uniref:MFS transporter n=1 Tax=Eiseniibacteriota bacterium TaxID=2212470 RepID=A0A956SFS9_UNCEI|nr:MFS transporter [Candidatus Eisenbacteria bacterium]MCB9462414.1 MFS transporter [Candidatus Eisenbacteria bacterium]